LRRRKGGKGKEGARKGEAENEKKKEMRGNSTKRS